MATWTDQRRKERISKGDPSGSPLDAVDIVLVLCILGAGVISVALALMIAAVPA